MRVTSKRSWPGIVIDILEAALKPTNKMKLMYKSNLNFNRFNKYLNDLLRKNFIEEINSSRGNRKYKTTEHGKTLLNALKDAKKLVSSAS